MELFHYSTIGVYLAKNSKRLTIERRPSASSNGALNSEFLFELETLLSWCTQRTEISTLFLTSQEDFFSKGLEFGPDSDKNTIIRLSERIKKITYSFLHLPQTIVFDLRQGAWGMGAELSLGADLRVCHENCDIKFDHLSKGLVAQSGGLSLLGSIVSPAMARNWLLSGETIQRSMLKQSGLIFKAYGDSNREELLDDLFLTLKDQAPVERIQTKAALLDCVRSELDRSMEKEQSFSRAAMASEDWKRKSEDGDKDFMPARHFSQIVKIAAAKKDGPLKN